MERNSFFFFFLEGDAKTWNADKGTQAQKVSNSQMPENPLGPLLPIKR